MCGLQSRTVSENPTLHMGDTLFSSTFPFSLLEDEFAFDIQRGFFIVNHAAPQFYFFLLNKNKKKLDENFFVHL